MAPTTTGTRAGSARLFRDRREAGQVLAGLLAAYNHDDDVIVLGLARGGVPVAHEVSAALQAPLDVFVVRKLGLPDHPEVAVGAIAPGGRIVLNDDMVRGFGVTPTQLREVAEREGRELQRREEVYRGGRPPLEVAGKIVLLVDDGLATGASMRA
ncbi:MAG: phosphoribosyltransferase family protein, partial [Actinomycetota bacterium]|nr:phosphoribosyltransferase family protein [Actinomycetota bacterium]